MHVEPDELPMFEKMRKPKDRNNGFGDGYVFGKNFNDVLLYNSCVYHTEELAKEFRTRLIKRLIRESKTYDKLEIYLCPNCGGYHFTSREKKRSDAGLDTNKGILPEHMKKIHNEYSDGSFLFCNITIMSIRSIPR